MQEKIEKIAKKHERNTKIYVLFVVKYRIEAHKGNGYM